MSEAGVQLESTNGPVKVRDGGETVELEQFPELQAGAGEDFLNLHSGLPHIDREYYYSYTGATPQEKASKHQFDSGLLEVESGHLRERPAYCVLAYEKHTCPPTAETVPEPINSGVNHCNMVPSSVNLKGTINPSGAKAISYHFEYEGQATKPVNVSTIGKTWARVEAHTEIPVPAVTQGTCPAPIHFRLIVESAQGQRRSADQT